jgi:hypothetical protein
MVDVYRSCQRAYELAYSKLAESANSSGPSICKRFILRGLAEVNRGKLSTLSQVQKFMGQNWPTEELEKQYGEKEANTRAFLLGYKTLARYLASPYRPDGAQIVAVALKLRARVAHVRVYVEDTIDLVLWYPDQQKLELVDFQTTSLKQMDPSWPTASMLFRQYLAERLRMRWPFQSLVLTTCRVTNTEVTSETIPFDHSSSSRTHWEELVRTLDAMKEPRIKEAVPCSAPTRDQCKYCANLIPSLEVSEGGKLRLLYKTA